MSIWSTIGTHNQRLHIVHSLTITSNKYGIRMIDGQGVWNICQFLCQSHSFLNRTLMSNLVWAWIVMFCYLTCCIFHINVVEAKILKQNGVFLAKWKLKDFFYWDLVIMCILVLWYSFIYDLESTEYLLGNLLGELLGSRTSQARNKDFRSIGQCLQ